MTHTSSQAGDTDVVRCKNCGAELSAAYCPACGQKEIDLGRPLQDLFSDVIRETFDLDGRAIRTIKTLFLRPGALTRDFLAGKRRLYTPPFRLYLVVSFSFFVLVAWLASQGVLLDKDQILERDAPVQAQFMSDELPRLMFLLLPAFALLLKVAFRARLYFDHLIFSVHLHSASYVMLALMIPLENFAATHWLPLVAQVVLLVYLFVYVVVAMRRVYAAGWVEASGKALAVLFAYMVMVSGLIETTSDFQIISD